MSKTWLIHTVFAHSPKLYLLLHRSLLSTRSPQTISSIPAVEAKNGTTNNHPVSSCMRQVSGPALRRLKHNSWFPPLSRHSTINAPIRCEYFRLFPAMRCEISVIKVRWWQCDALVDARDMVQDGKTDSGGCAACGSDRSLFDLFYVLDLVFLWRMGLFSSILVLRSWSLDIRFLLILCC